MRDDDGSAIVHQVIDGILYESFTFRIKGRCGFIQDEDGWVLVRLWQWSAFAFHRR